MNTLANAVPTFSTVEFSYKADTRNFYADADDLKLSPQALPTHIALTSQRTGKTVRFMRMFQEWQSDGELKQALYGNGATDTRVIVMSDR